MNSIKRRRYEPFAEILRRVERIWSLLEQDFEPLESWRSPFVRSCDERTAE